VFWLVPGYLPFNQASTGGERLSSADTPSSFAKPRDPAGWVRHLRNEPSLDEEFIVQRQDDEAASLTVLQGWVTDLEARPVADATVLLRVNSALQGVDPVQRKSFLRQRALGRISLDPPEVVAQATTSADGRYLIQVVALAPAVYEVIARQDGFAPQRQSWAWVGEPGELDFRLGLGASISGRAFAPQGNPLTGAKIGVLTQRDEGRGNWSGEPELVDQTVSANGGSFRLNVYPGEFQMTASSRGFAPVTLRDIAAGSGEVVLRLTPARRLVGVVLDQHGQPVAGAELAVWLGDGVKYQFAKPVSLSLSAFSVPAARGMSDDEGKFQFAGFQAGAFGLLAQRQGYTPGVVLGEIGRDEVTTVNLKLAPGSFLSGNVVDHEGSPVSGALVALGPSIALVGDLNERRKRGRVAREQFLQREGRSEELQDWRAWRARRERERLNQLIPLYRATVVVETDTEGRFRFDTLEEKPYDLSVEATDLLPRRLENLMVGEGAPQLTVVLESGARVEGQVISSHSGNVISGAIVAFGQGAHRRVTQTDPDGWYRMGGLLDQQIDWLTVRAGGFAVNILQGVDIPAGSRLDLALDPAIQVSGTVVDPGGMPASGAWVHVQPAEQSSVLMQAEDEWFARDLRLALRVSAQSDAAGYFQLDNVSPASSLEVCVSHP